MKTDAVPDWSLTLTATTEEMANQAHVDMVLWNRHSRACLAAAREIVLLRTQLDEARATLNSREKTLHAVSGLINIEFMRRAGSDRAKPCTHETWLPFKHEDAEYCAMCGEERPTKLDSETAC